MTGSPFFLRRDFNCLIAILSCGSCGELFVSDSIGLLASDGGGSPKAITMEEYMGEQ